MLAILEIAVDDVEEFLTLCLALDRESTFMMYEPSERLTSVSEQRAAIRTVIESPNSTIIVASLDGQLAGYVAAFGGEYNRVRHSA
ncbi:MAG: GNAT family N-acetyltransferase, partial [Vicinamibacterales bacterium]